MTFKVIDKKTGKEADTYKIALKEDWAKCLVYCDIEGFALTEDGVLVLMDECGNVAYCPDDRFEIAFEEEKPQGGLTEAEKIICKVYLEDLDKRHTCNEYKLLMSLIDNAQEIKHSLLPLSGEAENAYMRGYEVGKAEGILKASTRSHGEWKHIGGDEWVCSECGHVITTEGSWENPLSTGAYHCENCGADMRGGTE